MRFIILFFFLAIFGCSPEPKREVTSEWFDVPRMIDQLVINMDDKNHQTTKTFILNTDSEIKNYNSTDSSFWAKETAILRGIDLNSPQIKDVLKMTSEIRDNKSNLLIDEYLMPVNSTSNLKRLSIYYLTDPAEIRQIYAELKSDNLISHSSTKINLWINLYDDKLLIDSLQIIGCDKTFMQPEREYLIITKSVW